MRDNPYRGADTFLATGSNLFNDDSSVTCVMRW